MARKQSKRADFEAPAPGHPLSKPYWVWVFQAGYQSCFCFVSANVYKPAHRKEKRRLSCICHDGFILSTFKLKYVLTATFPWFPMWFHRVLRGDQKETQELCLRNKSLVLSEFCKLSRRSDHLLQINAILLLIRARDKITRHILNVMHFESDTVFLQTNV